VFKKKNFLTIFITILLTVTISMSSMVLAAGNAAERNETVFAGSVGGMWFVVATSFFELFSKNIDGLSYSIVPGGGVGNPIAIGRKDGLFAMGYNTNLHAAYRGLDPFKEEIKDLRGILSTNVSAVMHPFVLESANINSLKQIAEEQIGIKIDTGPLGTGGELAAKRLLEAYGITYEKIKQWGGSVTHSGYNEALDRLKDGHINMWANDDIIGASIFVELASARNVKLLSIDDEIREEMFAKYGYAPVTIPAGSYKGQDADVQSTAQSHVFFCHKDAPEELVYQMTKLVFEKKDELVAVHSYFEALDPKEGPKGWTIPLHPGAERYYKEIGVIQ